jgi:DNA-binding NtrC family response regulator
VKIIVIDDEQFEMFITKKLLSLRYETEGFTSVSVLLEWVKSNSFDAIFIDYYLENGMVAGDLLKKLREVKGDTFKAFVLSNYVDDRQVQELKDQGFVNVLFKPLEIEKLGVYFKE